MKSRTSAPMGSRRRALFLVAAASLAPSVSAAATTGTTTTATDTPTSTTQTGTIAVTGTTLPQLVTETESCAILCYDAACLDSGCSPGDFECVCGNPHSLVVKMGLCVGKDCDDSRQFDSGDWIADVCSAYDKGPESSVVASASSIILAEIAAAAATATNNPVPSTGTISNGGGTSTDAAASSTATSTTSAASAISRGSGMLSLTPVLVGLVGGAVVMAIAGL